MAYSVEKDVHPFVGDDPEVDIVLFITDGRKEPKKINIRRSIEGDENFSGNAMGYGGSNDQDMRDFLLACSRAPLEPIQFSFDTEVNNGVAAESSFKGSNGIQFCYQVVYNDGFVSAISPFSKIAYPDMAFAMGINSLSDLTIENVCNVTIPPQSDEARRVRILFRDSNEGVLKIIEEVSLRVNQSQKNWDLGSLTYSFRNNEVYGIVSNKVLEKNYDSLPQKANSQTVSDDRLMYGGYTEGFDQVVTNSKATVLFNERVTRFVGSEIEAKMGTTLGDSARGGVVDSPNSNAIKKQMHSGFRLDMSGMPAVADAGVYDIRINVKPEKNWHIFSSQSFYGKAFTYFNGDDGTTMPSGIINSDKYATNDYSGGNNAPRADGLPNNSYVEEAVLPVAGDPAHAIVNFGSKYVDDGGGDFDINYSSGTSPTNPLIVRGSLISFRVAFETKVDMSKSNFIKALDQIIMTGDFDAGQLGITNEDIEVFISPSDGEAPEFDLYVDLGLDSGDSFDVDDSLADLISHTTRLSGEQSASANNPVGIPGFANELGGFANYPLSYFIVNRANYKLKLAPFAIPDDGVPLPSGTNPLFDDAQYSTDLEQKLFYRFKLSDFSFPSGEQFNGNPFQGEKPQDYYSAPPSSFGNIMTCIPMPQEGLGAQTIFAIDGNNKQIIGMPYQGNQGQDDSMGDNWKGGDVDLDGMYSSEATDFNESEFSTVSNWSYYSSPLGPFAMGRVDDGQFEFRWPVAKSVSGTNVPNSNIAHPAANGLGVKDSDGNYLDFKTYDSGSGSNSSEPINEYGRVQGGDGPVAIGKWFVYDGPGISQGDWIEDFTFVANISLKRVTDHDGAFYNVLQGSTNGKFNGNKTFIGTHPKWWLPFPFATNEGASGYGATWLSKYGSFDLTENRDKDGSYTFSVMDGAAGPGGGATQTFSDEVVKTYNPGDEFGGEATGVPLPVSNTSGSVTNKTLIGICDNMPFINVDRKYALTSDSDFDEDNIASGAPKDVGNIVSIVTDSTGVESSFKTNDVHNFGIVYFDERGRASSVYRLDNVYVPGYSDSERGGGLTTKGSVDIKMEINHPAPSWAKSFKIVYAGAANTRRFIQTFAGGAYTEVGSNGTADDKIYISLNYLQGSGISYTKAFGAKDQDTGEPILYRFSEGDKLRVISSFLNDDDVKFHPSTYVFDVIGVEEISELQDVNPLISDDADYEDILRRTGSFLVVRNNLAALGFDAQKVSQGTSLWGDRCLMEIVTPKKSLDEELLPYFETDHGGSVSFSATSTGHVPEEVTISDGDTFFRVVPVNTREFIGGEFVDLIQKAENKDEDDSSSRFRGFFMESSSVSDLFRSQAKEYGRVHYVNEQASRNYNESGILWGDKNSSETYRPTITSFPSASTFLDLPKRYGPIDYLYDIGNQIVAFQETKVSDIQVNKAITTAANGGENLALSREVLNDPRFYKPNLGSNRRPESILVVENEFYFVDEDKKAMCRLSGQQIDTLSNVKMTSFFNDYFSPIDFGFGGDSSPVKSKYSLGYNPRTKEVLISKLSNQIFFDQNPLYSYGISTNELDSVQLFEDGDVFYGINENNPNNIISGTSKRDVFPYAPSTLSYSTKSDTWKTFYSFRSPRYEHVDNTFVSVNEFSDSTIWVHNAEETNNSFYGNIFVSSFDSFVNDSATTSHTYRSVSVDGDSSWNLILSTDKESTQVTNFSEKEGTFYSDVPRTEITGGSSHIKSVGVASSFQIIDANNIKFTFDAPIDGYTFNIGEMSSLYSASGADIKPFQEVFFSGPLRNASTRIASIDGSDMIVTFSLDISSSFQDISNLINESPLFVRSSPRFYGDQLRDKYLKIEAVKYPSEDELVSINIEAVPSNLDSSM